MVEGQSGNSYQRTAIGGQVSVNSCRRSAVRGIFFWWEFTGLGGGFMIWFGCGGDWLVMDNNKLEPHMVLLRITSS